MKGNFDVIVALYQKNQGGTKVINIHPLETVHILRKVKGK